MFVPSSPHAHPLLALAFLLADLFSISQSWLGPVATMVGILAAIVVSIYYIASLIQRRREGKQNQQQNVFQQMVDIAEARAIEIANLRQDITRLQQDISTLRQENGQLLHELQQLYRVVHGRPGI